jgi:ABC-type Fe3+/spermidine/putrescine transport system ATPase subunit
MKIAVHELSKRFGAVLAVDRVTLEIADGELFTLLGPSGCGKTTLLRLIAGFHRPDAGQVRFGERDVTDLPPYLRNIGMVFQNYALWPHMTVFQNVAYGLRLRRLRGSALEVRVEEGLRKVNLGGLGARYPGQLSGGQQQRVALARALVLSPDILLLDEPLSNLDAKIRVQVRAEIRTLQQELGITTVYVTHDQEEALSLSDRVAVMREGRVLQLGPPRELYERPQTRFVADFVGTNNLVPGRVVEAAGETLLVDTRLGGLRARRPGGAGALEVGQSCVLAIRPENVTIGARGALAGGNGNRCAGRIALAAYLGNTLRYDVETASGLTLKADIRDPWHHEPLARGTPVTLEFPASVTLALPEEPASRGAHGSRAEVEPGNPLGRPRIARESPAPAEPAPDRE